MLEAEDLQATEKLLLTEGTPEWRAYQKGLLETKLEVLEGEIFHAKNGSPTSQKTVQDRFNKINNRKIELGL